MVNDGPNCLEGPVSRRSPWWTAPATSDPSLNAPASANKDEDRPIRRDLVERVRREIAEGTYDTPEKWEVALERLFRQFDKD